MHDVEDEKLIFRMHCAELLEKYSMIQKQPLGEVRSEKYRKIQPRETPVKRLLLQE